MVSTSALLGATQYSVTRHGTLSEKWEIKSREARKSYWIQFPNFGPCMLLDEQQQPMGKISSKKFFTRKKNIEINTPDRHMDVVWRPTMSNFQLEGTTDVKGYETIDWKWKRKMWSSKLSLESKAGGSVIAEVRRNFFKFNNIYEIFIYETLPEDINWLILFSACYTLYYVQLEDLASRA